MRLSRGSRIGLRVATGAVLAFIYIPILVIVIYAFNENKTQRWPVDGLTLDWFDKAIHNDGVRDALWTSLQAAVGATVIALLLGTLAAIAVSRYSFFGKSTVSFLVVLPIALPGIVTGMALNATFRDTLKPLGLELGMLTVIIGHATFCVVVVYNNAAARLRRLSPSTEEASADLGATPWQTFAFITFPQLRSALVAGGLLAFGLSFDEVIVTTFTAGGEETVPLWILTNLSRPNQLPIVNVVAFFVVLLSIIPVYFAYKLTTGGEEGVTARTI
jgi:putative spermidine/putrescine transport system permease protein